MADDRRGLNLSGVKETKLWLPRRDSNPDMLIQRSDMLLFSRVLWIHRCSSNRRKPLLVATFGDSVNPRENSRSYLNPTDFLELMRESCGGNGTPPAVASQKPVSGQLPVGRAGKARSRVSQVQN